MKDLFGFNDRCILLLLERKQNLTIFDKLKIKKLKNRYSNYELYEDELIKHLYSEKFLDAPELKDSIYDQETGYWTTFEYNNNNYITSQKGILALKNNYYQSEYAKKFFETKLVRWGIIIGATGGIISLILNIINLFKQNA